MRKALIVIGGTAAVAVAVYLVTLIVALHGQNDTRNKNKAAADAEVVVGAHTYADRLNAALRVAPQPFNDVVALAPKGLSDTVGSRRTPGALTLTFDVTKTFVGPPAGGVAGHCYSEVLTAADVVSQANLTEIPCSQMMPVLGPGQIISGP